uniref:Uncharacterized protein n=1 Tax=Arundo donax TaxID=35708 RepID=A0A0A9GKE1_ARUDO
MLFLGHLVCSCYHLYAL